MNDQPGDRAGFGKIWLNRGIAAAKAGRRVEARDLLFRALNDESQREMAWLWLAAVSDDPRQEQTYLEKVLDLNPENRFAKAGLATLDKRGLKDLPTASVDADAEVTTGRIEPEPQMPGESVPVEPSPSAAPAVREERLSADGSRPFVGVAADEQPVESGDGRSGTNERALRRKEEPSGSMRTSQIGSSSTELESFLEDEIEPAPTGEGAREPSGWTTQTARVEPVRSTHPAEAQVVQSVAPAGFDSDRPVQQAHEAPVKRRSAYAEPRRAYANRQETYVEAEPRAVHRRPVRRPSERPQGKATGILSEAFEDHEMWTVLASTLSLVLLGLLMAFFFTLALTFGR